MKVMFDHNISHLIARALAELFRGEHEVIALRDRFRMDTPDVEWIDELSKEDRWVIISGDRRITRNKTEYEAFRRSRLVGFFLSAGLQKSKETKKLERILAQWESIEKQFDLVRGSAIFELQMKGTHLRQIKS